MISKAGCTVLALALAGCAAPAPARVDPPPESWKAAVERGNRAIQSLQASLAGKLLSAMEEGGPVPAISVCRDAAPALARQAAAEHGVELGRTSARLRNPANAPRPWLRAVLREVEGRPAGEVEARSYDLGDRIGIVRPIPTGSLCLACHGESPSPEVAAALAAAYPADRATGFREGDLRGLFWAEVPK